MLASSRFFPDSYTQARDRFRAACAGVGAVLESFGHPSAKGPNGEALSTEVACLGPADAPNRALIVTGTHGLEGFCGSAIVTQWIELGECARLADTVCLVVVHALNPWGYAQLRRTTENNVDLNRNFVDHDAPYPGNPRYAELHPVVCPAEWSEEALAEAQRRLDAYAAEHGRNVMMDALIRGQYSHPDGMNYGGARREWANLTMETIVRRYLTGARNLGFIDWHTGIGEPGELVYLCFNEEGSAGHRRAGDWWGAENVSRDAAFRSAGRKRPNYRGLVFYGVQQLLPETAMSGAVIEYGTRGSPAMYKALRLDRWLHFETDRWAPENAQLLDDLFDAFCPRAEDWRRGVLESSLPVMRAMCDGLAKC